MITFIVVPTIKNFVNSLLEGGLAILFKWLLSKMISDDRQFSLLAHQYQPNQSS
jgi:hypothetical protein